MCDHQLENTQEAEAIYEQYLNNNEENGLIWQMDYRMKEYIHHKMKED